MKKVMIISLGDKGKSHLSWDAGHEASLCGIRVLCFFKG
ncbi:hypothetical protein F7308_1901 [Francisella salina]|uniref:Uncharacterized protein n=1 Tax=Francisella salina TaxID=573569 RepID=A0ABN3ZTI4_FRAST|nr:hypothetical protein F7308_1901 [Francisella salina]